MTQIKMNLTMIAEEHQHYLGRKKSCSNSLFIFLFSDRNLIIWSSNKIYIVQNGVVLVLYNANVDASYAAPFVIGANIFYADMNAG